MLYVSYRTPRTTRSACLSVQTSRVVKWRCAMRIFLACGLMASRIVLLVFRSPVERKSFLVLSLELFLYTELLIGSSGVQSKEKTEKLTPDWNNIQFKQSNSNALNMFLNLQIQGLSLQLYSEFIAYPCLLLPGH